MLFMKEILERKTIKETGMLEVKDGKDIHGSSDSETAAYSHQTRQMGRQKLLLETMKNNYNGKRVN